MLTAKTRSSNDDRITRRNVSKSSLESNSCSAQNSIFFVCLFISVQKPNMNTSDSWRKRLSWWWCCLPKKSHFRRQMSPNRPGRLRKRGLIECVEPWIEKQNVHTNFQGFPSVHRSVSDVFDCLTCPPPPPIQSEVKCGDDYLFEQSTASLLSGSSLICFRLSHGEDTYVAPADPLTCWNVQIFRQCLGYVAYCNKL